jgi:hypothetical protein
MEDEKVANPGYLCAGLICDRRQCTYAHELAVLHVLQPRGGGM